MGLGTLHAGPHMPTNTRESQEAFVQCLAEVLHLGLAVSDAMKQVTRGQGRTARIRFGEQEWMIETTDAVQPEVKITLIE